MKPIEIKEVMDLTRNTVKLGMRDKFVPLFSGAPGVGKSQVIQEWCIENNLPFIDLRLAYLESPDMIGFPSIAKSPTGRSITVNNLPDFWPEDPDWEGVILFEEPNRGTTAVMNTLMQVLTDNKVHKYDLPKNAIICGAINPEDAQHDVNTMDAALKNRFVMFDIKFDRASFVDYMKAKNYDPTLIMYVESGTWKYLTPDAVGDNPDAKYSAPRSISQLNMALKANVSSKLELIVYESILGRLQGSDFYQFKHNETPVMYSDIVANKVAALTKLKGFCDPSNYKQGHISLTVNSIIESNEISDDVLEEVLLTIPADQSVALYDGLTFKRRQTHPDFIDSFIDSRPKVQQYMKRKLGKAKKA